MVKIVFNCPFRGEHVGIAGSFNEWKRIDITNITGKFVLDLPSGPSQYKYIVDGEWKYDPSSPIIFTESRIINNLINVRDCNMIKKTRIVHISDTHGLYHKDLPMGDVLVHTGDFTNNGTPEEYNQFNEWIGYQPYVKKIVIPGECDLKYFLKNRNSNSFDPIEECSRLLTNATVLNLQSAYVNGIKFYGIPWYWYHDKDLNYIDMSMKGKEDYHIPLDTDILITHSAPYGVLDNFNGSSNLYKEILITKPKYHLFGHIHDCYGSVSIKWGDLRKTRFENSSSIDQDLSSVANKPKVIDLCQY